MNFPKYHRNIPTFVKLFSGLACSLFFALSCNIQGNKSTIDANFHPGIPNSPATQYNYFLYALDFSAVGHIAGYQINSTTGNLTAVPSSPQVADNLPFSLTFEPMNNHIFVNNSGSNDVSIYSVASSTGGITSGINHALGFSPRGVATSINGNDIFVSPFGAALDAFLIDTTGTVFTANGTSGSTKGNLAVEPLGRFIYSADNGLNTVSMFQINGNGTLTSNGTTAITNAQDLVTDSTGSFLWAASGPPTNQVYAYTISLPLGVLVGNGTYPTTGQISPNRMAIDPLNRFLYTFNSTSLSVTAFTINSNGTLNLVGSNVIGASIGVNAAVAVDPTGKYLYVSDGGVAGNIFIYSINQSTGAISAGPVLTVASGLANPSRLLIIKLPTQ